MLVFLKEASPFIIKDKAGKAFMIYHHSIAPATDRIIKYYEEMAIDYDHGCHLNPELKLAIENEYAFNKEIEWQSLNRYINTLEEDETSFLKNYIAGM